MTVLHNDHRLTLVLLLTSFPVLCRVEHNSLQAAAPEGYQLTWADEFDGNSLDESSWWYRADEKQQSIQLPGNVEVDNGELVLNLTPLDSPVNGFDSAGAGVISQQRFHYGYYETRSKLGDGMNDDNDSRIDEGWHHAFWAMAAEADVNGHVPTTFPSFRRTEIDGYENGSSVDLGRMRQHVLPWNENGRITTVLPSNDVSTLPSGTENDWHTYGFEWTPHLVRFFIDDVLTKVALYPASQYEHDEINLWLTAISTNNEDSDQERSEARYDYFRYYSPGPITGVVGDVNQDGFLDELDITALRAGWLTETIELTERGTVVAGDLNLDGRTDLKDALALHSALLAQGSQISLSELLVAVPEPDSLALIAICCGISGCARPSRS